VLQQIVDELKTPKLQSAIHAARKEAGADVNAMMQEVVPIFYEGQRQTGKQG
jgi:hypothetical protein